MSHTVEIRTEVRDPVAIDRACQRLQLPPPTFGSARLHSSTAIGWQVQLPQWAVPDRLRREHRPNQARQLQRPLGRK